MLVRNPIVPKNLDGVARIISVGRLSKPKDTEAETQRSLQAIRAENERMLNSIYQGPKMVRYLGEQISGMLAERETMDELWDLVGSGDWDAIIAEDLSRVFRNPRWQYAFVQDCVDVGIRVIAFADSIDTASEDWETTLACATVRHGLMIPDTRRRIKRTATESFKRGGMVMKVKAFYAKVSQEDANAGTFGPKGLRIRKLTDLTWAVDKFRREILDGCSARSIVNRLNNDQIPCGPYVKSGRWTLKVFRELVCDPILHGTRTFRDVVHTQIYRTGKFRRDKNESPESEYSPELAFMTREEQEEMLAKLGWTIDWGGKQPPKRPSSRKGISRYESYWPAQSSTCGACGGVMYASGKFLKCSNSFCRGHQTCWNHVLAPIAPLREAVVKRLVEHCHASDDFRQELVDAAKQQLRQQQSRRAFQHDVVAAKVKELDTQERNLRRSIRIAEEISDSELTSLVADLATVTKELQEIRRQAKAGVNSNEPGAGYEDHEIVDRLPEVLMHLMATSFEMAEVIRGLVPQCVIVPVQALDTGQIHPRAKLLVRPNVLDDQQLEEHVVDPFVPPVHIRLMPDAVRLRGQKPQPTYKQIGAALGTSYMTVKRALGYARRMAELGVNEPFRELTEKPKKAARWRDAS